MTIKINGTNTTAQPSITGTDTDTGLVYGTDEVKIVTGGTDRVTVNNTGLGIGTSSPTNLLHVNSSIAGATIHITNSTSGSSSSDGLIINQDGNDTYIWNKENSFMSLGTNNTERMRILSDGTIANGGLAATPVTVAAGSYIQNSANAGFFGNNGDAKFGSSANNPVLFQVNGGEKARIDSSGRVGIGTSSPIRPLSVSNGGAEGFEFGPGDTAGTNLTLHYNRSTSAYIGSINQANYHTWSAGGASEKMRIDSSGRLGVGFSSPPATFSVHALGSEQTTAYFKSGSANVYLQLANSVNSQAYLGYESTDLGFYTNAVKRLQIASNGTSFFASAQNVIGAMSEASAGTSVRMYYGSHSSTGIAGTVSYTVWTNGNVVNTNNSYGSLSDVKLKENIVDANSQWDDIKGLRVRNYNFIEGQTHTQIGVIAQEAEAVSPGLVYETTDRDEEGIDLGTVTKSVNYSVLYMKAVKALQEAMERIESLETQNASLEARLTALEGGAS